MKETEKAQQDKERQIALLKEEQGKCKSKQEIAQEMKAIDDEVKYARALCVVLCVCVFVYLICFFSGLLLLLLLLLLLFSYLLFSIFVQLFFSPLTCRKYRSQSSELNSKKAEDEEARDELLRAREEKNAYLRNLQDEK
jgi:hypothetical protein